MARTPNHPPPDLTLLRAVAKAETDARGGRSVAVEMGMSKSWLFNFVAGKIIPRNRTLQALRDWHSRLPPARREPSAPLPPVVVVPPHEPETVEAALGRTVDAALHALTMGLAPERGAAARENVVRLVLRHYAIEEREPPEWIKALRTAPST